MGRHQRLRREREKEERKVGKAKYLSAKKRGSRMAGAQIFGPEGRGSVCFSKVPGRDTGVLSLGVCVCDQIGC